jgi:two-component system, response regulator YesN
VEKSLQITVLVAEDEDLIRQSLKKKIESLDGFLVVGEAQNGREAYRLVQERQPDLIFTDIRMPVMDGMELVKALHLYFPRIRKVITSGYADFEYARQALSYHVDEYLLKPINTAELQRTLHRLFTVIENENSAVRESRKDLLPSVTNPKEIVELVQSFLRENFHKEISLEQIARSFNFNASYLSKIFIKYTEEPPSKYLMRLRINEAKYLLVHHRDLPIKEVGERVGYPDPYYFSRIFKQMTGSTPKEFQK